jgi:SAM-dependent methyltransferase
MQGMLTQLRAAVPTAPVLAAAAERLPFARGSLDGITVAQAFHWFDAPTALIELRRTLKADGLLIPLWNHRDMNEPWVAELTAILNRYEADKPRPDMETWRTAFEATDLFTPLEVRHFRHSQAIDRESIVDRVTSMSFVILLEPARRQALIDEVQALMPASGEALDMPYDTEVFSCRAR